MNYDRFGSKGLINKVLLESVRVTAGLEKPGHFFKARAEPKRPLTQGEAYMAQCGFSASHLLSSIQKIDCIKAFIEDGSVSKKMKKEKIKGHEIMAYHIENFIIRSQSILERFIIFIDGIFDIGNDSQFVNYNIAKTTTTSAGVVLIKICRQFENTLKSIIISEIKSYMSVTMERTS